jgi:hypothetical protein
MKDSPLQDFDPSHRVTKETSGSWIHSVEIDKLELEELDLEGIVDACARKETNSIPEKKIQLLQFTLLKSNARIFRHLGVS